MNKIGKYEIRSELGRGAMGIVYLGYDPIIERPVAIKTMNAEAFEEEEQKQRFLREARSAGAMQHPNIVTIYEMGMEGDTPYIAMEYVEGQDLTELIKKGELESLEDKLAIMEQLCDALYFAHKKEVIHRDIKPGNIRILPDGTVKIMDFGIAKKQDSDFTRTGLVVGTLSYMSPEQVQGKPLDPRSDQFSAGVVFYQMLTGKKPFGGDNLTNVVYQIISFNVNKLEFPGIPTVMKKIVQKMMNPDPEKRFHTCGEVSNLLKQEIQYLQGEGDAPTVFLESESPTETTLPPIPVEGTSVSTHMPVPVPIKKKNTLAIVLGVLFVFALLTKEQAVFLPFLIVLCEACFFNRQEKNFNNIFLRVTNFFIILAGYFYLRTMLFGACLPSFMSSKGELLLRVLSIPLTLLIYLRMIIFPYDLHYYRSVDILKPFLGPSLLLIFVFVLFYFLIRLAPRIHRRLLLLGLGCFLVSLAPLLNIVPLINEYSFILTAEHFLYFPVIGIFLFYGDVFTFLQRQEMMKTGGGFFLYRL